MKIFQKTKLLNFSLKVSTKKKMNSRIIILAHSNT